MTFPVPVRGRASAAHRKHALTRPDHPCPSEFVMPADLSWGRMLRRRWLGGRRSPVRLLQLEYLEDRTLLSNNTLLTAVAPSFGPFNTAQASGRLTAPGDVDLYKVSLHA